MLSLVVDYRNICAVNEAYSGAMSEACEVKEHRHGDETSGHDLHKAAVGEGLGKGMPPMDSDTSKIIVLEVTVGVEYQYSWREVPRC